MGDMTGISLRANMDFDGLRMTKGTADVTQQDPILRKGPAITRLDRAWLTTPMRSVSVSLLSKIVFGDHQLAKDVQADCFRKRIVHLRLQRRSTGICTT